MYLSEVEVEFAAQKICETRNLIPSPWTWTTIFVRFNARNTKASLSHNSLLQPFLQQPDRPRRPRRMKKVDTRAMP